MHKRTYDASHSGSALAQRIQTSRLANQSNMTASDASTNIGFGLKRLLILGFEAEINKDFERAEKFHKDRVALFESEYNEGGQKSNDLANVSLPWSDLASFHARRRELKSAIECASEAVSKDKTNVRALCLYGSFIMELTCSSEPSQKDRSMEANITFEAALEAATTLNYEKSSQYSSIARGLLGALYHMKNKKEKVKDLAPDYESFLAAAKFLAESSLCVWGVKVLDYATAIGDDQDTSICIRAEMDMADLNHTAAILALEDLVTRNPEGKRAWALLGQCHHICQRNAKAMRCFQHAEALSPEGSGPTTKPTLLSGTAVRQMYGELLLETKSYETAREVFLRAAKSEPNATLWMGAGIASFRLGQLEPAELALSEANLYDNHNPSVWAYLTLVCMKQGREQEAEASFKTANVLGKYYCCPCSL